MGERMKSLRRHPWDFLKHLEQLTVHFQNLTGYELKHAILDLHILLLKEELF